MGKWGTLEKAKVLKNLFHADGKYLTCSFTPIVLHRMFCSGFHLSDIDFTIGNSLYSVLE